ncbi:glycosyltransferase [Clostridium thermopalmarium]|uniref:Glycosyl transferases group 1 n=1 Tax=Clostridium thermopalmarium DSM 5974 TaxID=1121340 RepID=A0A2T0AVT9_9CLOT|nr:glycosyltransferase [Clostridium thermopalmarium]PRR74782.1 Glycosyl transferases group 1 [Clostridium thermopalmarium DSM 5974]PVZ24273.1 glycosyltransferase involved in cell wall biosynthesis [Clostridium thermopalmarium DSM 5974]
MIKLYETYITPENYSIFNYYIKTNLKDLSEEDKKILMNNFMNSSVNTEYLNILDKSSLNMIKSEPNKILHLIDKFDIENIDTSGAKIILELILPIIKENNYFKYGSIIELKSFKRCVKFVLNRTLNLKEFDRFSNEELLSLLDKYLDICVHLITIGNKEALHGNEYRFCKCIIKAFEELQNKNLISAVKFIRDGVKEDSVMARPMRLFIDKIQKDNGIDTQSYESEINIMNNEMNIYSKKVKRNIEELITKGSLDEAFNLIQEYIEILPDDVEVYSMKAVILVMQNKLLEAKLVLEKGLKIDKNNFDLLYNLAYVYENLSEFNNSLRTYIKAIENCNDKDMINEINNIINKIKDEHKDEIKQRIVFFVKEGMDSFINDIISGLSQEFEVKKVITVNDTQIDEGMEWADICWFEWCDELIVYGSNLAKKHDKKIICRIHGYEVYTNYIRQVNWKNVDQLIIVAPHIRRIFEENTKDIDKGNLKINTVFCGVNVDKYKFEKRTKGFNLGYLGYINFKKNIPLTLDIFKKLHDIDNRYKLHIAGRFQDDRTLSYLIYFIKEHNLENSFKFYGWLDENEKIEWFKNIDYMIISSIDEGLCYAAAESMCSGIKPILHNCEGIKDHYDKKYIFDTLDEAVEMIVSNEYYSSEYRNFIKNKYSLKKELENIKTILNDLFKKKDENSIKIINNVNAEVSQIKK